MFRGILFVGMGLGLVATTSCTSPNNNDITCVPGMATECACGTETGTQVCNSDGFYEACDCSENIDTGSGRGDFFTTLPLDWDDPPEEEESMMTLLPLTGTTASVMFECERTKHVVQRNYDSILALGDAYTDVKPGMILQGGPLKEGNMTPVPLARSPISVSIDLGVRNPARLIPNPTSSSIQVAVADLQREADSWLGTLPDLPARINYHSESASSFEEAALDLGVNVKYAAKLFEVGIGAAFGNAEQRTESTVVARLYQPMYTISFGDDEISTPRGFFSDTLTDDDFWTQSDAGTMSRDNLPVFVKSVTYGRILLFSITSNAVSSTQELSTFVRGSFLGFSGDSEAAHRYQEILESSEIRLLALGGSAEDALYAIRAANYNLFFTNATATTAIPLNYHVQYLLGGRPTARLGNALEYVSEECDFRRRNVETLTASAMVHEASSSVDSGLTLESGDEILIRATGNIRSHGWQSCNGPEGQSDNAPAGWPLPGARRQSLIASVEGSNFWHYVGASRTLEADVIGTGRLIFRTNDDVPGNGNDCTDVPEDERGFLVGVTLNRESWE